MINQKTILIAIILILSASTTFFSFKYFNLQEEFEQTQIVLESTKTNEKVLDFTKLFIEKVLKADAEVDFETRLQLENAVRDLKDEEILVKWQNFVESKTEEEAQNHVKNLLEMLVWKIQTR